MKKNKSTIIVLVTLGAVLLLVSTYLISKYNGMATYEEKTLTAWSQVENVYQRRADLIPNLVKTVKGAADFERSTLTEVIEARNGVMKTSTKDLSEAGVANFQQSQDRLTQALSRMSIVIERYPELKANQNFLELQSQLEGTENRISVERNKYNEVVNQYNTKIIRFPSNLIAKMFGFEKKGYFKSKEGAENAPEIAFEF